MLVIVSTGAHTFFLGAAQMMPAADDRDDTTMTSSGNRRVAFCECGAQLVGDSEEALFAATERHLAHHHPQLLGAMELETVQQMAEEIWGQSGH